MSHLVYIPPFYVPSFFMKYIPYEYSIPLYSYDHGLNIIVRLLSTYNKEPYLKTFFAHELLARKSSPPTENNKE